jgi:delta24-sterol reductase
VVAYEIISADGEFIRATRTENTDLYYTLPMSHGTLGFLVAVELTIVPVKKYMKVHYFPFDDLGALSDEMIRLINSPGAPDFLEGLVFSSGSGKLSLIPARELNTYHCVIIFTGIRPVFSFS